MSEQDQVKIDESKVPQTDITTQGQSNKEVKQTEAASKPAEESPNEINWRKFRQEREKERKEKAELERKNAEHKKEAEAYKAAMEAVLNKPTQQSYAQQVFEESSDETEEQKVKRLVKEEMDRERANEARERQQREVKELPQTLSKAFNDFNAVCTEENLDYLEYHYPEVVAGMRHMPESFEKWAMIYKAAKRFIPNTDRAKDLAKIEKNTGKPQSMSAPGATQTGDQAPSTLTDQRRQDNWARMRAVMKGGK